MRCQNDFPGPRNSVILRVPGFSSRNCSLRITSRRSVSLSRSIKEIMCFTFATVKHFNEGLLKNLAKQRRESR